MPSPLTWPLVLGVLVAVLAPAAGAANPGARKSVVIVNGPANPVPVAVQGSATVTGSVAISNTPSVTVTLPAGEYVGFSHIYMPAGRRFVIEYVSTKCKLGLGEKVEVTFDALTSGVTGLYTIPVQYEGSTFGFDAEFGSQMVKVYVDPGTTIGLEMHRQGTPGISGSPYCDYSFSGYLVTVP